MVELMQNLIELSAIIDRMGQPLPDDEAAAEVTSEPTESYIPVEGITYI